MLTILTCRVNVQLSKRDIYIIIVPVDPRDHSISMFSSSYIMALDSYDPRHQKRKKGSVNTASNPLGIKTILEKVNSNNIVIEGDTEISLILTAF